MNNPLPWQEAVRVAHIAFMRYLFMSQDAAERAHSAGDVTEPADMDFSYVLNQMERSSRCMFAALEKLKEMALMLGKETKQKDA
jgi:hypothetical protein